MHMCCMHVHQMRSIAIISRGNVEYRHCVVYMYMVGVQFGPVLQKMVA